MGPIPIGASGVVMRPKGRLLRALPAIPISAFTQELKRTSSGRRMGFLPHPHRAQITKKCLQPQKEFAPRRGAGYNRAAELGIPMRRMGGCQEVGATGKSSLSLLLRNTKRR